MLSPSPALLPTRGKEGLAQIAPGLGESQLQTGFHFLPKYHWQHIRGTLLKNFFLKMMRRPTTVDIKEIHQQHPQPPNSQRYNACGSFRSLRTGGGLEEERTAKWSAQAVLEDHS